MHVWRQVFLMVKDFLEFAGPSALFVNTAEKAKGNTSDRDDSTLYGIFSQLHQSAKAIHAEYLTGPFISPTDTLEKLGDLVYKLRQHNADESAAWMDETLKTAFDLYEKQHPGFHPCLICEYDRWFMASVKGYNNYDGHVSRNPYGAVATTGPVPEEKPEG